jgi:glucose/arabinose dehydrogenase
VPSLPPGFSATLFVEGLITPRHIAVSDNGDVYVTIRSGQAKFQSSDDPGGVVALRDIDGDGRADSLDRFGTPDIDTGLALANGTLYFSSMTEIFAVPLGSELLPPAAAEVVVAAMPESCCGHRSKPITIDGDGNLYTQVGSPSNACQAEQGRPGSAGLMPCNLLDEHGGVFRFSAVERNQIHAEVADRYSTGHRNVVALEWNESAGALYVLMHGRDGLNQLWPERFTAAEDIETPAEEFHRLERGDDLGWPYTYFDPVRGERMLMPEYGGDGETPAAPADYKDPLIAFPAHWAPNDLVFYSGTQFPARYRNGAFIAFHGAVNPRRVEPGGHAVAFVPMNAAGEVTGDWELFADDFEDLKAETGAIGRPSGLAVAPDGALFIVDDSGGRIWRVSYTGR